MNGRIETYPRLDVFPESSEILLDGNRLIFSSEEKVVYLVNKPIGYLSAMRDDRGRKTLSDLVSDRIKERVFHVGRLDQDSCGLILMTNDGDLSNLVSHPASEIEKTYVVGIKGKLTDRDLEGWVDARGWIQDVACKDKACEKRRRLFEVCDYHS